MAAAKKPATKKPAAKQPAAKQPAKQVATRKWLDPLAELAWDTSTAFDGEDATPAMHVAFVDGFMATAKLRGLDADFETSLPYCADALDLQPNELRATYEAHHQGSPPPSPQPAPKRARGQAR